MNTLKKTIFLSSLMLSTAAFAAGDDFANVGKPSSFTTKAKKFLRTKTGKATVVAGLLAVDAVQAAGMGWYKNSDKGTTFASAMLSGVKERTLTRWTAGQVARPFVWGGSKVSGWFTKGAEKPAGGQ